MGLAETGANIPAEPTTRLYFQTYLHCIKNAVGSQMFRNFYTQNSEGRAVDTVADGRDSSAFFVSSVLTLFRKHSGIHDTVDRTLEDLETHGWQQASSLMTRAGDVLLWTQNKFDEPWTPHLGFDIGNNRAVSTCPENRQVVEHDICFNGARSVSRAFRYYHWDLPTT